MPAIRQARVTHLRAMRSNSSVFLLALSLQSLHVAAQNDSLSLRIIHSPACDTVLTMGRLQQLPSHTVEIKGHDGQPANYTGALLMDVLGAGCPSVPATEKRERIGMAVRVDSWDGYHAITALMEADTSFRDHPVLLTWSRNGIALDGHDGPFQLIIPDDRRHARDVRRVKQVSVVTP
jgi:hypothetical protein